MTREHGDGTKFQRKSDGRWVVRIELGKKVDGSRNQRTVYCDDEAHADKVLRTLNGKRQRREVVSSSSPTVASWLEDWWNMYAHSGDDDEWSYSTARGYRNSINKWIVPELGRVKLDALTKAHVQKWLNDLKAAHGSRRRLTLAHACLRSALSEALRENLVTFNAADKLKVPGAAATKRAKRRQQARRQSSLRYLTPVQAKAFLKACEDHYLGALFVVALASGMRLGEVCGLAWDHYDDATGTIHVAQQLQRVAKGKLILKPGKSENSDRHIQLPPFARAVVKSQRAKQAAAKLKAKPGCWKDCGLMFTSLHPRGENRPAGQPLQPRNVARALDEVLTAAGLQGVVTFHGLRHSAASLLIAAGMSLVEVSKLLGHSELRVTSDFYLHLQQATASRAATMLESVLR